MILVVPSQSFIETPSTVMEPDDVVIESSPEVSTFTTRYAFPSEEYALLFALSSSFADVVITFTSSLSAAVARVVDNVLSWDSMASKSVPAVNRL